MVCLSLFFLKWEIAFHENIYLSWWCFFSIQPFCFHVQHKSFLCRLHFVTQNIKCIVKGEDLMKLIIVYLTNVSIHWDWLFFCIWWKINAVIVGTVNCCSLEFYPSLFFHQSKYPHRQVLQGVPQVAGWWRLCLPVQQTWGQFPGRQHPLEKEIATHSTILAWEIWKT